MVGNSDITQGIYKLRNDIENTDWFQSEFDLMLRLKNLTKDNTALRLQFKKAYRTGTW